MGALFQNGRHMAAEEDLSLRKWEVLTNLAEKNDCYLRQGGYNSSYVYYLYVFFYLFVCVYVRC